MFIPPSSIIIIVFVVLIKFGEVFYDMGSDILFAH